MNGERLFFGAVNSRFLYLDGWCKFLPADILMWHFWQRWLFWFSCVLFGCKVCCESRSPHYSCGLSRYNVYMLQLVTSFCTSSLKVHGRGVILFRWENLVGTVRKIAEVHHRISVYNYPLKLFPTSMEFSLTAHPVCVCIPLLKGPFLSLYGFDHKTVCLLIDAKWSSFALLSFGLAFLLRPKQSKCISCFPWQPFWYLAH